MVTVEIRRAKQVGLDLITITNHEEITDARAVDGTFQIEWYSAYLGISNGYAGKASQHNFKTRIKA